MTRLDQFFRGLGSSWLATFATVIYSLLSVPIALRYLTVDEFGLFVLLLQVAAYFSLVEIGMSAATARILVDYKDRPDDGNYGTIILTGFLVFGLQALIIVAIGAIAAPSIILAIGIPTGLAAVATLLLKWLALTSALAMAFRIYGSILYANKRLDLINIFIGLNMLGGLGLLAAVLAAGGGLVSLVWVFLAQTLVGITLPIIACHRLGLLPKRGCWGKVSKAKFFELFSFAKDIFLVNVGNQVLEASQLIIITRTMGLTAAAVWSISTKLFTLVYQLVARIQGTATVFFAEMMVRGEKQQLAARFRQIYQLTAGISVAALASVVGINEAFVSAWAKPELAWALPLSCLMAIFVWLNALTRCSGDLIVHTKQIRAFRYVYFAEAAVFVSLALWLSPEFGFYGVLGSSIFCLVVFRATYTTLRVARYFDLSSTTIWWTWLRRPIAATVALAPFVLTAEELVAGVSNIWWQLFATCAWVGVPAVLALFLLAVPRDVQMELWARLRHLLNA